MGGKDLLVLPPDRLSGGKVGYIHLPDTAEAGNRMLQKLFYPQTRKPALIVDDRYNGGGFIPVRIVEYLSRRTIAYWARRDVESSTISAGSAVRYCSSSSPALGPANNAFRNASGVSSTSRGTASS